MLLQRRDKIHKYVATDGPIRSDVCFITILSADKIHYITRCKRYGQ